LRSAASGLAGDASIKHFQSAEKQPMNEQPEVVLYHHGSSTCASKVRFALMEKGIPWTGRYIDILKGEQFDPAYLALNPKAVVPTLVHRERVLVESTVICEYLEDAFPGVPLMPADPYQRAQVRLWTKLVDEELQPAAKYITYASCHRHIIRRMPPAQFEQFMAGPPGDAESRVTGDPQWVQSKRDIVEHGVRAAGVDSKFRLYDRTLQRMEETLVDRPWLAGDAFSLADVSLTPYVNRLHMLGMAELWAGKRPRVDAWFQRVRARPTFQSCFPDQCPPELTRDLATYGSQTWPEVKRLLEAA
jgi:glutathione S-transferase